MRTEPLDDRELEAALADLGSRLAYPSATGMAAAVRARLAPRRGRWYALRSPRLAYLPAIATAALLFVLVLLASPDFRAAAEGVLGLRGVEIFRIPFVPTPAPTTSGAPIFPGTRVSGVEAARSRVAFTIRVPTAAPLGVPDAVYVDAAGGERLTLVYERRPGIPVSPLAGVSAVVVEFRGRIDEPLFGKSIGPTTRLTTVTVNGGRGFWLEGEPHMFFYLDAAGNAVQETLRLAGNTLLWEQGGVTMRLEAAVSRDEALRIASSFR